MGRVLIIDDDKLFGLALLRLSEELGNETTQAYTCDQGMNAVTKTNFDVVLLDVFLPDGNGLDLLKKIRTTVNKPEVIIMTGQGDPDGAELAIKTGAWDYIEKTASTQKMKLPLIRALKYREEKQVKKPRLVLQRDDIIGNSIPVKGCLDLLAQAADNEVNVLITGETGTGKDVFARTIHSNSNRSQNKFVVVDCAALPETLVESVLFGHEKGAFTGADKNQEGLIKNADGGTLFLDEIGELSYSIQKKFLRFLQERKFRTVGGKEEIKSSFRLIAATNRDLDNMVRLNKFRKDLLYRLKALEIKLPALKNHTEDIKEIVLHYITKYCEQNDITIKGVSSEFIDVLMRYDWPGNIRELINIAETAITAAKYDHTLLPIHLPIKIRAYSARTSVSSESVKHKSNNIENSAQNTLPTFKKKLKSTEREYIKDLLMITQGDIKKSIEISGLSKSRLYGLIKEHKLKRHY